MSKKEVEVASYLDLLHTIQVPTDLHYELISFEDVVARSDVEFSLENVRNDQSKPTTFLA